MVTLDKIRVIIGERQRLAQQLETGLSKSDVLVRINKTNSSLKNIENILSQYKQENDALLYKMFSDPVSREVQMERFRQAISDPEVVAVIEATITRFVNDANKGGSVSKLSKICGSSIRNILLRELQKNRNLIVQEEAQSADGANSVRLNKIKEAISRQTRIIDEAYNISLEGEKIESEVYELNQRRLALMEEYNGSVSDAMPFYSGFSTARKELDQSDSITDPNQRKDAFLRSAANLIGKVSAPVVELLRQKLVFDTNILEQIYPITEQINEKNSKLRELKKRIKIIFDAEFTEIPAPELKMQVPGV